MRIFFLIFIIFNILSNTLIIAYDEYSEEKIYDEFIEDDDSFDWDDIEYVMEDEYISWDNIDEVIDDFDYEDDEEYLYDEYLEDVYYHNSLNTYKDEIGRVIYDLSEDEYGSIAIKDDDGDFLIDIEPFNGDEKITIDTPSLLSKIAIKEDGSFENYVKYENNIEYKFENSKDNNFELKFRHPKRKGFDFYIPSGSNIELSDSGEMSQTLIKDEKRVELLSTKDGNFEAKLKLKDGDINKTREFLGVDGSRILMGKDTNISSIYIDQNSSLSYHINFDINGTLFAVINKVIPKIDKNIKSRNNLGIAYYGLEEIVSYEMLNSYLDGGLQINTQNFITPQTITLAITTPQPTINIKAQYTTDSEFNIDIDKNLTIYFKPLKLSSFKEITHLDKSKEVTLLSGKCDISVYNSDENFSLSNLNNLRVNSKGIYIKNNLDKNISTSLTLNSGWNLISIPISAYISKKFINGTLWSYNNKKWTKNPEFLEYKRGYWLFVEDNESVVNFEGFSYKIEFYDLELSNWKLLGSGVDLSDFDKNLITFIFRDKEWIKNSQVINRGEGFWIKKED